MKAANASDVWRNTSAVMGLLVFVLVAISAHQYTQIQQLVRVDCAALEERQSRIDLYDSIIASERQRLLAGDELGRRRVEAYERQKVVLQRVANASRDECD